MNDLETNLRAYLEYTTNKARARERLLNKLLIYMGTITPNAGDFEHESGFSTDYEAWESICTDIENLKYS